MMGQDVREHGVTYVNPAVEGLDPNSKDLTPEQMRAIIDECMVNPSYFFAIVCKAQTWVDFSYLNTHYTVSRIYSWDHPAPVNETRPSKPTFGLSDGPQPDGGCDGSTSPGRSSPLP